MKHQGATYRRLLEAVCSFGLGLLFVTAMAAQAAEPYRINAGDRLSVAIYGNPDQSGELQMDANGAIVHPLAGSVPAVGRSVEEVQTDLSERISDFLPNPTVTVSIAAYAPVFVLGDVETPGQYAYRPGLSALQLIALAGGLARDLTGLENGVLGILDAQREFEELSLRIFASRVTITRLQSELSGEAFTVRTPAPAIVSEAERTRIVEDEQRLFALRREQRQATDRGLAAQVDSYAIEISSLEQSIDLYQDELSLLQEDVAATQALVDKGLSTPVRLREIQREMSARLRDSLELQTSLARARQGKLEAQRRRTDSDAEFRTRSGEALKAARAEESYAGLRLIAVEETLAQLRAGRAAANAPDARSPLDLTVTRTGEDDEIARTSAVESTRLSPGDILTVARPSVVSRQQAAGAL